MLILAGTVALDWSLPIGLAILGLLAIVSSSYWQTIHAFPSGGGSYIVARENLGTFAGLLAAAALLVDYVLTVSVSVAAGVAAVTSALPGLLEHRVALGLAAIAAITIANLRGVRESGRTFALPTYGFITCLGAVVLWGMARLFMAGAGATAVLPHRPTEAVSLFLLLRAFASGCTALTGSRRSRTGSRRSGLPSPGTRGSRSWPWR